MQPGIMSGLIYIYIHLSYCQDLPYQGTLNSGHKGPSFSLVYNVVPDKSPCPLSRVGNIDSSSYDR